MNIITTSQKSNDFIQEEAKRLASSIPMTYVKRNKLSMIQLFEAYHPDYIAVLSGDGLTIYFSPSQHHTFHLSMAQLRILRIQRGEGDHLINAVQAILTTVKPVSMFSRFSLLDCTAGIGSDSIVLSYGFPDAHIECLEASSPIWLSTSYGLRHYEHRQVDVTAALRRISMHHAAFEEYLPTLKDNAVDILYFDPMFEVPIEDSPQFKPLRGHTAESGVTEPIIDEAMRVAKYGFIIKERPFSSIFQLYPPDQWIGGKYSRIGYGVYIKETV